LEKLCGLLQVKDATPLSLSQQYEARNSYPTKSSMSLETGDAASSFEWTILALQEDWLGVEIRICPALLNHVSQVHAPLIFTPICPTTETWLPHFHAIVGDLTERFRRILGYFTLEQMNHLEGIFENI